MHQPDDVIQRFERAIIQFESRPLERKAAHSTIAACLSSLFGQQSEAFKSLSRSLEYAESSCEGKSKRTLASLAIRIAACKDLLTEQQKVACRRHIVKIIESTMDHLLKRIYRDTSLQTHEKLDRIEMVHHDSCQRLATLLHPFQTLRELSNHRNKIMTALNDKVSSAYLNPYNYQFLTGTVDDLLNKVQDFQQSSGQSRWDILEELVKLSSGLKKQQHKGMTFVERDFVDPFIDAVHTLCTNQSHSMKQEFTCSVKPPREPYTLEKKYPLHVGRDIEIPLQFENIGPGIARNLSLFVICDSGTIENDEIIIGDVPSGPFFAHPVIHVTEEKSTVTLEIEATWYLIGEPAPRRRSIPARIHCQRSDLDWESLAYRRPYSLEVAPENEFFGREDAIRRILGHLHSDVMQSCYITGQKRVGKSSLALAVRSRIESGDRSNDYHVLYLEAGEFRKASGKETLGELGTQLESFFSEHLSQAKDWTSEEYGSSLVPLIRLLNVLRQDRPHSRFIVMLDEFDEINEDLYRYGDLADTFFLNLRTLSSKSNLAFVLVGAERMPFVMESQGERLNRFFRESLDTFDVNTDRSDYAALVRTPVIDEITITDSALRILLELTNGHPYYTKMLCAALYERAVVSKDSEVSDVDVRRTADQLIPKLDTNSFAHYWRDGIRGGREATEIFQVHRCRLLVGWARTARKGAELTYDRIRENVSPGASDSRTEVSPLLEEFCNRRVFYEHDNTYDPCVRLFSKWLRENGFREIVSDQLGEQLAEEYQRQEDEAYVESREIVDLCDNWHLYQGRQISEDSVRAWIQQAQTNVQQRLLFKLLVNLRFVSDLELRKGFEEAHKWMRHAVVPFVKRPRAMRRSDIYVAFCDGQGKSGRWCAGIYADVNDIVGKNVLQLSDLSKIINDEDGDAVGLVIVDDMIGSGNNLIGQLKELSAVFEDHGVGRELPLSVVVFCATGHGRERVDQYLGQHLPNSQLQVCELLEDRHFAFIDPVGFWRDKKERDVAKNLVRDLGLKIDRRLPLGYDDQGMLLKFTRNTPNNSLPILHSPGRRGVSWRPLFRRINT